MLIAADIAQLAGGKLHIVTAYDAKAVKVQDLPDEFRYSSTVHPADVLLQGLSREVSDRGLEPVVHTATASPAEAIIQVAEQVGADLIVVGNKGMKGRPPSTGKRPQQCCPRCPLFSPHRRHDRRCGRGRIGGGRDLTDRAGPERSV